MTRDIQCRTITTTTPQRQYYVIKTINNIKEVISLQNETPFAVTNATMHYNISKWFHVIANAAIKINLWQNL